MAVHPASLEVLEKAAVPPAQARAIVQAIEIEIAGAKDTLATKQDTLILRHDMAEGRAELRTEITDLRVELRTDISDLRAELKTEIAQLRTELKTEIAELRQELREKLSRSEFQAAMVSQVRHTYGAIMGAVMGQFALLLGAAYFFVTHVQR